MKSRRENKFHLRIRVAITICALSEMNDLLKFFPIFISTKEDSSPQKNLFNSQPTSISSTHNISKESAIENVLVAETKKVSPTIWQPTQQQQRQRKIKCDSMRTDDCAKNVWSFLSHCVCSPLGSHFRWNRARPKNRANVTSLLVTKFRRRGKLLNTRSVLFSAESRPKKAHQESKLPDVPH